MLEQCLLRCIEVQTYCIPIPVFIDRIRMGPGESDCFIHSANHFGFDGSSVGHRRLWKAFNLCSVLSCIGLLGVSAISVYTNIFVHLIFAFLVFIAGILIMLISTVLDSSLKLSVSPTILALRYGLTAIAIVSGSLLGVFFVPYPFFGSVMEMIAAGAMTAYVWTFAHKLDKLESAYLELGQVPKFPDHAVHRRRIV